MPETYRDYITLSHGGATFMWWGVVGRPVAALRRGWDQPGGPRCQVPWAMEGEVLTKSRTWLRLAVARATDVSAAP